MTTKTRCLSTFLVATLASTLACGSVEQSSSSQEQDESSLSSYRSFVLNQIFDAIMRRLAQRDRILESLDVGVVTFGPDSLIMPDAIVVGVFGVHGSTFQDPPEQVEGFCEIRRAEIPAEPVNAGEVTVVAGSYSKTLVQDASGEYPVSWEDGTLPDGTSIVASMTGADDGFPSLRMTETLPAHVTLVAPELGDLDSVLSPYSLKEDLAVEWTPTEDAEAYDIHITPTGQSKAIHCSFPAPLGHGVVSSSLLKNLPAPEDGTYRVNAFPVAKANRVVAAGGGKVRHASLTVERDLTWGLMSFEP